MSELLLFLLMVSGITFTVVHAEIMDILKIRPFLHKSEFVKKLTHCSLCTGFWVGLILSFSLKYAFAASIFSYLVERLGILLDELILEKTKK